MGFQRVRSTPPPPPFFFKTPHDNEIMKSAKRPPLPPVFYTFERPFNKSWIRPCQNEQQVAYQLANFIQRYYYSLTHFSRMELPALINWNSPFPFIGGIFFFCEHYVNKQWQWRPGSGSALFAYVPQKGR